MTITLTGKPLKLGEKITVVSRNIETVYKVVTVKGKKLEIVKAVKK